MAININVNGQSINYPEIGDTNWADEATDFAVQTASAFGKLGLDIGTTVDIPGTLDVTGNTTLDANLSVSGNATITGNLTANGNSNLGNASVDTIAVTGILNVNSGVLYVDPTNNRVGINDTTPSQALDVTGDVAITGNETVGGTLGVTGDVAVNTNKFNVTATNGNTSIAGTLGVTGATTLSSTLGVTGDVAVNTNKFNVTATNGNTSIAGTLGVTGATTLSSTLGVTGNTTLTGTLLNSNGSSSSPSISFSSDTDNGFYYIGSNNFGISIGGSKIGEFNSNGIQALNNYVLVVDEKTAGTQGGTFTSGAMRTRDLNTTKVNRITGYSLSSNQITLPAGTYRIHALVPSFDVSGNLAKLRNITDSTDVLFSNSGWTITGGNNTNVVIIGEFTIASQKTFEIQHQCTVSGAGDGFGTANTIGVCIYTQVELWKLA